MKSSYRLCVVSLAHSGVADRATDGRNRRPIDDPHFSPIEMRGIVRRNFDKSDVLVRNDHGRSLWGKVGKGGKSVESTNDNVI